MSSVRSRWRTSLPLIGLSVVLAVWVGWLRAPSIGVTMWNVDETIHAAVARTLLDGGVMYRDAVDQRSPLTYYAFAAIFRVAGMNNLVAVRIVVAGMIVLTAVLLYLIGRRMRNTTMGLFAAFIHAALTSHLLFPGDLYAAHTEWFVALFTTCGGALFLTAGGCPSYRRSFAIGAFFALAFLSKQPALTDLGAPIGTLLYLGVFRSYPWRHVVRALASTIAGFVMVVGPVILLLVAAGAGSAMVFYTWTYNVTYYGPEIDLGTRLLSPGPFFNQLLHLYPLVLIAGLVSAAAIAIRVVQLRPSLPVLAHRGNECFLLLWCATSLVGAMSGGRGYDHYFFQCLPPFALLAAWAPGVVASWWSERRASPLRASVVWSGAIAAAAMAFGLFLVPTRARNVTPPPLDPALTVAEFIREHSLPTDKIFAWGYNPDIYMYADRSPASRFVYCSFQTGLIPWTNEDPSIDTSYAIVPGSMETLLADLEKSRPVFIIDCGVGPHRRFTKYPLNKFPSLRSYVDQRYVEINPAYFLPYGFRVLMLRDSNAEEPPSSFASSTSSADTRHPVILGPTRVGVGISVFNVQAWSTEPDLQRLALYLDNREIAAVKFPPAAFMNFQVPVNFEAVTSAARVLQAKVTLADGTSLPSEEREIAVLPLDTSDAQQTAFALPIIDGSLKADGVRALYNPRIDSGDGTRTFALHAPSFVSYTVPKNIRVVRGNFGIPPGAYAAENQGPSDGAEFSIRLVTANGEIKTLLNRMLNPLRNPSDRAVQAFYLQLGELSSPARLEFEITAGPAGNAASDWTYWSDITLETSP